MRDSCIRAHKSLKTSHELLANSIPDWVFSNGTGSSARQQSRPNALFVSYIPGRQAHLDPSKIPPRSLQEDPHSQPSAIPHPFCPNDY
eukprot:964042-Pelagomonas_calceolata.AAC.1